MNITKNILNTTTQMKTVKNAENQGPGLRETHIHVCVWVKIKPIFI